MKLLTKYRETLDSDDFFCFKPWIDESGKRHFNLKKVLRHFKHKLLKDSYVPIYDQFINEITKYDTIDVLMDGMTYKEDVAAVKESFSKMLENGTYKGDLFSDL